MIRMCIVLLMACLLSLTHAAENPDDGDIRSLKVGTHVSLLPTEGYERFACGSNGGEAGIKLDSWNDFQQCPPEPSGLHEVRLHYDDSKQQWAAVNDKWEGTKISGHPVLLSLLIGADGFVKGIRAVTDPSARAYMHKKAYLLSFRVKARYGRPDWVCQRAKPSAGKTPIGGQFIDERCEKTYGNRQIILQTRLYRDAGQSGSEFTNSTRFEILALSS